MSANEIVELIGWAGALGLLFGWLIHTIVGIIWAIFHWGNEDEW